MATKYFVYAGLEFQTEEVALSTSTGTVDAVTLESIVAALGDVIDPNTDPPDAAADAARRLTTVKGWWSTDPADTELDDRFQLLARQVLRSTANLAGTAGELQLDNPIRTRNFHLLAHIYILPPHLGNAIDVLSMGTDEQENTQIKLCVKALQVRHDNIIKHDDADDAWQAYIIEAMRETSLANSTRALQGYYVNPAAVEPDDM